MENKKYAVISLSGGMDSSTLLLRLLNEGYEVTALSFDYGQKHKVELEKATELVKYINTIEERTLDIELPPVDQIVFPTAFYPVKHQIIKLDGLSQLLNSSLVEGGSEVPEGHYADENMKDTVVPNRNKIFSSIIQAVALSISEKNETNSCAIAMGIHAGDHAIYPDCRQEFRDADYNAFLEGNWGAEGVYIYTPYIHIDKFGILEDGEKCCKQLGLDFDEIYKRTNTSYKPIPMYTTHTLDNPMKTGPDTFKTGLSVKWYSDFKSASSVERVEAFIKLGRPDPAPYAEILPNGEIIPRTWEEVVNHVTHILKENEALKQITK